MRISVLQRDFSKIVDMTGDATGYVIYPKHEEI